MTTELMFCAPVGMARDVGGPVSVPSFVSVTQKRFVSLTGHPSVECVGRHPDGSSWLLPDGRVLAEIRDGAGWRYVMVMYVDRSVVRAESPVVY